MPTIKELYDYLDREIPRSLSCEWDNDGLMVCADAFAPAKRVLLALDATDAVAEYAVANGFDAVITHHPMLFSPLRSLTSLEPTARKALFLAKNNVAVMSFHTRLDAREGGVNDVLAEKLGIINTVPFGPEGEKLGRIGVLPAPADFREFCAGVSEALSSPMVTAICAKPMVQRVAVLGGGGKDFVGSAISAGADVLVTGEVTYNVMLEAKAAGLCLVTAGHYHTERPVLSKLYEMVKEKFAEIEVEESPSTTEIFAVK
ncbi:MAG: Nif3-like dinuclear metal center hexameric protein [Clostridia bacterium]|nr:Nif3-like dinuclear metal center hexameric protein [Clostridia bacterium]